MYLLQLNNSAYSLMAGYSWKIIIIHSLFRFNYDAIQKLYIITIKSHVLYAQSKKSYNNNNNNNNNLVW